MFRKQPDWMVFFGAQLFVCLCVCVFVCLQGATGADGSRGERGSSGNPVKYLIIFIRHLEEFKFVCYLQKINAFKLLFYMN